MNKIVKIILGVFSFLPLAINIMFLYVIFDHDSALYWYDNFGDIHRGTVFLILGLLVYYIVHVLKSDKVPKEKRTLWIVVLLLGHMFSIPIYWYHYIWKEKLNIVDES